MGKRESAQSENGEKSEEEERKESETEIRLFESE